MKKWCAFYALLMMFLCAVFADEGMFSINELKNLDQVKLKKMGLDLSLTDLEKRLPGTIVNLGGGTGSFVSRDGLIITNHHVAYMAIQYNSSKENNYIRDGFYAPTRDKELQAPNYTASVVKEIVDVTSRINANVTSDMSGKDRYKAIEDSIKHIQKEVESREPDVYTTVAAMYQGKQFLLFKYLRLRDVRLVYAPPDAIGEFGGDVDNFEWPRHTGDFAFLRAYVGKDGKPADYAPENVPYHPDEYFAVSLKPLKENDFTMVLGFPGGTDRYMTAKQMDLLLHQVLPLRIGMFRDIVDILVAVGRQNEENQVRVASFVKGLNNAIKKYEGDYQGLTRDRVATLFAKRDREMQEWIQGHPEMHKYESVVQEINAITAKHAKTVKLRTIERYLIRLVSTLGAGNTICRWAKEKSLPDLERDPAYMDRNIPRLKRRLKTMQRNLVLDAQKQIMVFTLKKMLNLPAAEQSKVVSKWFGEKSDDELTAAVAEMISKTHLTDTENRLKYFELSEEELQKVDDPLLKFAGCLGAELKKMNDQQEELDGALQRLSPMIIELLHAYTKNELYSDANSTLRLAYGKVTGYAKDGVTFTPFTTLRGAIVKEQGRRPFANPSKLIEIYRKADFGVYADSNLDGQVPLDFLTDLDTTGGNSGSPTLNGQGELIGLLFDGNFESISSDYYFNPALTRSIVVDSRYILFILDKFSNAQSLMDEMTIVK